MSILSSVLSSALSVVPFLGARPAAASASSDNSRLQFNPSASPSKWINRLDPHSMQMYQELSLFSEHAYRMIIIGRLFDEIKRVSDAIREDQGGSVVIKRLELKCSDSFSMPEETWRKIQWLRTNPAFIATVNQADHEDVIEVCATQLFEQDFAENSVKLKCRALMERQHGPSLRAQALADVKGYVDREQAVMQWLESKHINHLKLSTGPSAVDSSKGEACRGAVVLHSPKPIADQSSLMSLGAGSQDQDQEFLNTHKRRVGNRYASLLEHAVNTMYEQGRICYRRGEEGEAYYQLFIRILYRQKGCGSLALVGCKINLFILTSLIKALEKRDNMTELDLSHNEIDDEGASLLEAFALNSKVITKIDLNNNRCQHYNIADLLDVVALKSRRRMAISSLSNAGLPRLQNV